MASNPFTQANRLIAIATTLGDDELLLKSFHMTQELGRPFICEVELRSLDHAIDFDKVIGQPATIRVNQTDGKVRYISGIFARIAQEGPASPKRINKYRATLVPGLWFLSRATNYRIHQKISVPDVIKKVLEEFGVQFELKLTGKYGVREYVTQYDETALDFVHRLMEEEGLFYYFAHDKSSHTMRIVDSNASLNAAAGYEDVPFVEQERTNVGKERIFAWGREKAILPYEVRLREFDYRTPDAAIEEERKSAQKVPFNQSLVKYDYHPFYTEASSEKAAGGEDYTKMITPDFAKQLAMARMEEIDCRRDMFRAHGDTKGIDAGHRFTLSKHPVETYNAEYIVTAAQSSASVAEYAAGGEGGDAAGGSNFDVTYTVIKADTQFRTARTTPWPKVAGPQTGVVVGPAGDEVHTDMDGRVKVYFPWDREAKGDEKSSCWIRVAQVWAGAKYGGMFIPRVGHEVIVEFIDGDPDKPIVTGRVYSKNGGATVPYKGTDFPTMSTIKSSTSKGGQGFNEIRFEDKKDEEQIFIHGEKQLDIRIKKDCYETIGNDRHLVVVNDQIEHVKHDRSETVDNDHKELIKNDRNLKIQGKEAKEVTKSVSLKVDDDVIEEFGKNQSTVVKADHYLKAKNIVIEAEESITIKVTDSSFIGIDKDTITVKTKAFDLTATQKTIDIKAMKDITVTSDTGGLTAKSLKDLSMETSTGKASMKGTTGISLDGTTTAELMGAKTEVSGKAMTTIKGGVVMIN